MLSFKVILVLYACLALLSYAKYKKLPVFKFTLNRLWRVIWVNTAVSFTMLAIVHLIVPEKEDNPLEDYKLRETMESIQPHHLALAGFEEVVFVLPAFFLPPVPKYIFLGASSIAFAKGHAYQGTVGTWQKITHVALGYYLAAQYGILTTIAAHSLFDLGVMGVFKAGLAAVRWQEENTYGPRVPSELRAAPRHGAEFSP